MTRMRSTDSPSPSATRSARRISRPHNRHAQSFRTCSNTQISSTVCAGACRRQDVDHWTDSPSAPALRAALCLSIPPMPPVPAPAGCLPPARCAAAVARQPRGGAQSCSRRSASVLKLGLRAARESVPQSSKHASVLPPHGTKPLSLSRAPPGLAIPARQSLHTGLATLGVPRLRLWRAQGAAACPEHT